MLFSLKKKLSWASLDVFTKSQTLDNRSTGSQNSCYEKGLGERRGSVPIVSAAVEEDSMDSVPSTPSRIASFFSKKVIKSNLKRTKSVTKLDQKKKSNLQNEIEGEKPKVVNSLKRTMSLGRLTKRWTPRLSTLNQQTPKHDTLDEEQFGALINARMRTSRSHESLLTTPSSMHSIDLSSPDIEIKPLHSSILGQDHCFQVSTSSGSKYYSCRTAEERQQWIQCLRKTVQPNQEQTCRTDNSLKLWVVEAKNVPSKKKYFCEVCLDKTLYAKTSSKMKGEMLFWGEQFDFTNLPKIETITINIYKEPDKKKKKEKNALMGYINIPVEDVSNRQLFEKWYTASSATVGKAGKENKSELPILRVKARYQSIQILPMDLYQDLIKYIQRDYCALVSALEPVVAVKSKEEIATCMVRIMQKLGKAKEFLPDIVMQEVDKLDNENLTFRGNSIGTKAMEAYMKLVGERYLKDSLGDFIKTVVDSPEDCEVDPTRIPSNASLQRHQTNLVMYCEMAWFKIINSHCFFPVELCEVFASFKEQCLERKKGDDISDNLISACIFLRFLCPAILSPSLFNLIQQFPQEKGARNLTLIAKVIQSLANFTKFGAKEEFMTFLNDVFIERELQSMKEYLHRISTVESQQSKLEFDGYIDLGKELSTLHSLLRESLEKMSSAQLEKLNSLRIILDEITDFIRNPNATMRRQKAISALSTQFYDNLVEGDVAHLEPGPVVMDPNANATDGLLTNLLQECRNTDLSCSHDLKTISNTAQVNRQNSHDKPSLEDYSQMDEYVLLSSLQDISSSHVSNVAAVTHAQSTPNMAGCHSFSVSEQQVDQSWKKMVSAAEMVNGDYVDLISFVDDGHTEEVQNSSAELDNGSIGQLSTVASSGYQSFGYSQSSSPVDSGVHNDGTQQPLSFANPLFKHQVTTETQTDSFDNDVGSSSSVSSDESSSHTCKHSSHSQKSVSRRKYPEDPLHRIAPNFSLSSSSCESLHAIENGKDSQTKRNNHPSARPIKNRLSQQRQQMTKSSSLADSSDSEFTSYPLTSSELSKSAEFTQLRRRSPKLEIKRTATDSFLVQGMSPSPTSPDGCRQFGSYANKRSSMPQNTVRMGVRSVQQRLQQPEKGKADYELELQQLRLQLAETQAMLAETQERLASQSNSTDNLVTDWQQKLEKSEVKMKKEQQQRDEQTKGLIARLNPSPDGVSWYV